VKKLITMPSFPPRGNGLSDQPLVDGNNGDNADDTEMSDERDGGASLAEEEKMAIQEAIMIVSDTHVCPQPFRQL
jgi:hypothetical protein